MKEAYYNVVYADPPWSYGSKKYQDGGRVFDPLTRQYPTMSIENIESLPIKKFLSENCACFMWVTDSHLKEGVRVMEKWGFQYKTIAFVWLKKYHTGNTVVNFAPWTLKSTEVCLLGIRGSMGQFKKKNNVQQLVVAERTRHSRKPDEVRKRIEDLFGDVPRIEMFAREKACGWHVWGNEIGNDIEL